MENETALDRETYRRIKSMSREKLSVLLNDMYAGGKKEALSSVKKIRIDMDKIRSDISAVNGVGKVRLSRIMEIIEKHMPV